MAHLEKGERDVFLRSGGCVQMENRGSSQSSALRGMVGEHIGTRRDSAEFPATQKVSELAERKFECKDLQQADKIVYKTY